MGSKSPYPPTPPINLESYQINASIISPKLSGWALFSMWYNNAESITVKKTTNYIDSINSLPLFFIALNTKFWDFIYLPNFSNLKRRRILTILIKPYPVGINSDK